MGISDDDKRQIMKDLAQGNVDAFGEIPILSLPLEQNFDPRNYQNFDDFAQRTHSAQDQQLSGCLLPLSHPSPESLENFELLNQDDLAQAFADQLKQRGLSNLDSDRA